MTNSTSNSTAPSLEPAPGPSEWDIYLNKVLLRERHFHFSVAFFSVLASFMVIATILDMGYFRAALVAPWPR